MKYYILIILITITIISCEKDEPIRLSPCLLEKVGNLANCETASITKYFFQGSIVYYIDPGYCLDDDGSYEIIDSNCEVIGRLGGFGGNEEVNGVHFFENAQLLSVVWEME